MSWRSSALATAALFAVAAGMDGLHAQQPADARKLPSYRRIFVPQEDLPTQVRGLLPLKRAEFDRRIAAARDFDPGEPAGLRISRAEYTARLEGQDLVGGEALLDVATTAGKEGLLSLEPCNLALSGGLWQETPPRRAVLGIGARNVLSLQVTRPGRLLLPWSRRGQLAEGGGMEFDLSLPPASLQRLRLHLPADLQLTATDGLVMRDENVAPDGMRPWAVELGGIGRTRLLAFSQSLSGGVQERPLFKEQVRYALTPTDLTAEFQFSMQVHSPAIDAAQLRVDPRLTITTVSAEGRPAAWSVSNMGDQRMLSVQFSEPLAAGSHTLTVNAVAEVAAGNPWRLPRITWPQGVWQEGTATLVVPPGVQLAVSRTSGCGLAKGVPTSGSGENLALHYFSADGFAEIAMLPRQPRLSGAVGASVQFDPAGAVSATLRVDLTSPDGELFEADAVVSNDWVLDAIETEPADLLEDRPVVAQDERSRTMRLKFVRPITPQSPVRLIIRARLQQPSTDDFSARSLWRWFRLPGAIEAPAVLALRNNIPNYDLQVRGDGDATRLTADDLSADELERVESPSLGLHFRLSPEAADFRVLLQQGEPRYTAAWDVTAACSRSRLRQQAVVRCLPSGPGLSRITIHSVPPPDREIRWRVSGGTDATVAAQTRRDTVAAAGVPAEAVWELEFSRPLTQPFTLESTWESPRTPRQSAPLFACLEAASQTCHVSVSAEDDARWFLAARGLSSLPMPDRPEDRYSPVRGLFRYESPRQAALAIVDYGSEDIVPLARVTAAELSTRFASDGSALHELSLTLANAGLSELPLTLPPTASLRDVAVAGVPVEPQLSSSPSGSLRIPLPRSVRDLTVSVSYASAAQQRPLYARRWQAELPELNLALPPLRWMVLLPPGTRSLADAEDLGWTEQLAARFWGPFARQPWLWWLHPWRSRQPLTLDDAEAGANPIEEGWSRVSEEVLWSSAVSLVVFEPARWSLLSLSLALFASGLVLATPRHWLSFWWWSAMVLATAVLALPLVAAPLVAGAFWGLVAGALAALLRPRVMPSFGARPASTTRGWAPAGASAAVIMATFVFSGGSPSLAQPRVAAAPKAKTTHRVVIPIDDQRQPVGDYVFVDGEFYDWLHEQAESGQPGEPWQLENADYEIRWPLDVAGEAPAADITARLEISTTAVDAAVTLPFRRAELLLQQGSARLDGSPVSVAWGENGQGLTAMIPAPGRYRLELSCSAPLKSVGRRRELSLAIPRAPHSIARIRAAAAAAPFTSTSALGSHSSAGEAAGSWQVQLGSAAELSLQSADADAGSQQAVEAEQFVFWKIRPGSVIVDALCNFRALTGVMKEVQIRFDPRLRLLPLEGLPPTARHWVETGAENTLHVAFSEPMAAASVRPRFLLAESSGVGKIVPPRISASAGRISRSWLAFGAGPGVELAATPPSATKIAPAEFAQAFGIEGGIPAAAFDVAAPAAMPELEFRPAGRAAIATAKTTLACGMSLCRLTFQAELTGLSPAHVQQRIVLPAGWVASDVAIRDGDLPLACRWFQQADGTVVVRLDQPPGSSQQMRVDAALTPAAGKPISFPAVQLMDVAVAEQGLLVTRSYDCSVEMRQVVGWQSDGQEAGQPQEQRRRLVASLVSAPMGEHSLMMVLSPNQPQVASRLVTRYARGASGLAAASLLCDLDITGGNLDELRLQAPPAWRGPWETSPPLAVRSEDVPGQTLHFVTLTPDRPLTGKVRLLVSSPLKSAAGEPPRVPEIALVDVPRVDRLVQLPKAKSGDPAEWKLTFLQPAQPPADLQDGFPQAGDYDTFTVTGPHFDAVLSTGAATAAEPVVSLIKYDAAWLRTGIVRGRAAIHLDPSRLDSCLLDLGEDYRPLSATLDGTPADVVGQPDGRWLVRLPGERLPQRLEVEFLGSPSIDTEPLSDRRSVAIRGPTVAGLPARATIWTLQPPPSLAAGAEGLSEQTDLVQVDQDLARLTSAVEMLARASNRELPGLSGEALTNWLAPWREEISAASRRVASAVRSLVVDDGGRQVRFRQLMTELDRHWQELQGGPFADDEGGLLAERPVAAGKLAGAAAGPLPSVELTIVDPAARQPAQRYGAAAAVLLVAVAAALLARWPVVRDWLAASAPFAVAAGGIALAGLSPLGLAALAPVLIALAATARSPWSPRLRGGNSGIVRLDRHSLL